MIKVLHCGDMHLDSPFTSTSEIGGAERRKDELISDFLKMMDFCKQNEIDIVLIAGDLFDSANPAKGCVQAVTNALGEFGGRVFISPGNHDPYISGSVYEKTAFPENVYIFDKDRLTGCHFEIRGCKIAVYGYAFTSYYTDKNPLITDLEFHPSELNLVCAHGDICSGESDYAPITRQSITDLAPHYLALAHIHKRSDITFSLNTAYSYCGSLSARDFGETGKKGCYYLEFDSDNPAPPVKHQFIPIGKRRYEELKVNASNKTGAEKLISSLFPGLLTPDLCLRIILTGEVWNADEIIKGLEKGLGSRILQLEIQNRTTEPIDYQALENDPSIAGEFYRMLKPRLESDSTAHLALRLGLAAIKGEDPASKIEWIFNGEI